MPPEFRDVGPQIGPVEILGHLDAEDLLNKAPSCQRAIALFEVCQFGSSGDVSLAAIVTHKCEGDFLGKLNAAQKRA